MTVNRRTEPATPEEVLACIHRHKDVYLDFLLFREHSKSEIALQNALDFVLMQEFGTSPQYFKTGVKAAKSKDGDYDVFCIYITDKCIHIGVDSPPDFSNIPVFASTEFRLRYGGSTEFPPYPDTP